MQPDPKQPNAVPEPKSFKVPQRFNVHKILEFLWDDLDMKSHVACIRKDKAKPAEYLQLELETKMFKPKTDQL